MELRIVGGLDAGETRSLAPGRMFVGPACARVVVDRSGAAFVDGRPVQRDEVVDLKSSQIVIGGSMPVDAAHLGPPDGEGVAPFHRSPRPALPPPPAPVRAPAEVPLVTSGVRFSWAAVAAP